eukprot:COSAG03_NODE_202_length_10693_cov_87.311497_5_plen_54_part_00
MSEGKYLSPLFPWIECKIAASHFSHWDEKSRGEAVRQKGSEVPMSRYVDSVIH